MSTATSNKPRLRKVWRNALGWDFQVWQATYKGHTAYAVCPIWAYCEVREKARRGW